MVPYLRAQRTWLKNIWCNCIQLQSLLNSVNIFTLIFHMTPIYHLVNSPLWTSKLNCIAGEWYKQLNMSDQYWRSIIPEFVNISWWRLASEHKISLPITAPVLEETEVFFIERHGSVIVFSSHSALNNKKDHSKWFLIMINDKTFTRHLSYNFF